MPLACNHSRMTLTLLYTTAVLSPEAETFGAAFLWYSSNSRSSLLKSMGLGLRFARAEVSRMRMQSTLASEGTKLMVTMESPVDVVV